MPDAVALEVRLPERGARAAMGPSAKKPMAEVSVILADETRLEIVVPVRVGRLLMEGEPPLPAEADEIFSHIHALEARVAMTQVTEMLGRRDHSIDEVRVKLRQYGYRPEEIEPVLSRAQELRYLDDTRFAVYFVEERKRRGWGRRKIELELSRKGISPDDLLGYPDRFFSEDEDLERARALLDRKSIPAARPFEKLVRFLMGKGFSYSLAADAVHGRLGGEE